MPEVSGALRLEIRMRACERCEYCLYPAAYGLSPFEVDHVIASKHGGETVSENLAWCCSMCNRHKGTDIASIDALSGQIIRLFHPRLDRWTEHFRLDMGTIVPLTSIGRTTERLLLFNAPERIEERHGLWSIGLYAP